VGSVQKLATVVIVGLVAVSTVLVLYLADENNRIKAEERSQQDDAIERATANYLSLCLPCHGPAGEGLLTPGEQGTGRIGLPLGGNTYATKLNQQGIQADGSPVPGGVKARATVIASTIHNGRVPAGMPAWGEENGGPLNPSQIEELTTMIQNVDWNRVYNEAIKMYGGYPTANPTDPRKTPTPSTGGTPAATPTTGGGQAAAAATVDMVDIAFDPKEITIPANTAVKVNLANKGAIAHNFNVDQLNVHSGDVQPGGTGSVTITAAPGDYQYYCAVPGHKEAGMVGTLHVK
jgi:plastocyanin/mono/diheme cytochrome c family protein